MPKLILSCSAEGKEGITKYVQCVSSHRRNLEQIFASPEEWRELFVV
jgi:hypothetical protein